MRSLWTITLALSIALVPVGTAEACLHVFLNRPCGDGVDGPEYMSEAQGCCCAGLLVTSESTSSKQPPQFTCCMDHEAVSQEQSCQCAIQSKEHPPALPATAPSRVVSPLQGALIIPLLTSDSTLAVRPITGPLGAAVRPTSRTGIPLLKCSLLR